MERRINGIMHLVFISNVLRRTYALNTGIEPSPLRYQWVYLSHVATVHGPNWLPEQDRAGGFVIRHTEAKAGSTTSHLMLS